MPGVFVPGWGASAGLYQGLVPQGWEVLKPPSFRASGGSLSTYRTWLRDELARRPQPMSLGGHSFGAALAVLAATDGHAQIDRLLLVGPAGLPLSKPMRLSLRDFFAQVVSGLYPLLEAIRLAAAALAAPKSAVRLARAVRRLDLCRELEVLRSRGLPCVVVSADSDTLTPPAHCRAIADLAGGDYRELHVPGGHMFFLAGRRYETAK